MWYWKEVTAMSEINLDWPVCSNCPSKADVQCLWCHDKFCRKCTPHHARVHSEDSVD